ncbi:cathepsin L1-like precursor [Callorhinchus milii]|uniref:Cathepsin L1 n=1 Tax=Callorhinchus milii TaxID=7868 RepID=K4FTG7_CALMI|nr:cathepsin L1-like precursor [Callorhinchus milii]AFK11448.1 cathepsin L1 [Callorhinchus milii]
METSLVRGYVLLSFLALAFAQMFDPLLSEPWLNWKSYHGREYMQKEDSYRRAVWEKNLKTIQLHNLGYSMGKHSFDLAMNQFGDMTTEEFHQLMNGFQQPDTEHLTSTKDVSTRPKSLKLPGSVDWRDKGYVTPVKNQGACGSCWAFSSTGALEGQTFKKTGKLIPLSEQNLVDCSQKQGNHGCNGGMMDRAFTYIQQNNGIDTEASYPYTAKEHPCNYDPRHNAATCHGYRYSEQYDEMALAETVATIGPISVAIDAKHISFQFYKSGIYQEPRCQSYNINHAVLVVGYNSQGGNNYWIVKNSFGSRWGNKGYIWMPKDKNNHCGIASYPTYPLV